MSGMLSLSPTPTGKLGRGELRSIPPSWLAWGLGGSSRMGTDSSSLPS